MTSDNSDYVYSPVKPGVILSWDNLLGFPVEKILPEYFLIDRNSNLVGITTVQIAMIEYEKIMGSINDIVAIFEHIPADILEGLFKESEMEKPKSFLQRINPLRRNKITNNDVDPMLALKLIHNVSKVRFELFSFVLINLSNLQAQEIKKLNQSDKTRDYENLKIAYKDILNRSSKQTKEAHLRANPKFVNYIPEDGIVINATTRN